MTRIGPQSDVLLRTAGIHKHFFGTSVLNSVNVEIHRGEIVLLRGDNGSGKTTLINILTGNLEADGGVIEYFGNYGRKHFSFPRSWKQKLRPSDWFTPELAARERVARTWQDLRLFQSQTLVQNVAVARPEQLGESPLRAFLPPMWAQDEEESMARARRILRRFGLVGRYDSSADRVSLGQAKKAVLGRALASEAEVFFLDEPLSGLDYVGAVDIIAQLAVLARDHGKTLVISEHVLNQPLLAPLVTTDWLLSNGQVTVTPAPDGGHASSDCDSHWRGLFQDQVVYLEETSLPRGAVLRRMRRIGESGLPSRARVLEIRELVVKYGDRVAIGLDDEGRPVGLSINLYEGDITILEAPNGWGKTTLARAIAGLQSIASGSILLDGHCVNDFASWTRNRCGLSTLLPDAGLFPELSVRDILRIAGGLCEPDGWGALLPRQCSTLSGGERQRLALYASRHTRASIHDEPFLGLDRSGIAGVVRQYASTTSGAYLLLVPRAVSSSGNMKESQAQCHKR